MALDVNSALTKAYDELRNIDSDLSTLSGVQDRFTRKRTAGDTIASSFSTNERRVQDGGRKIIMGPESSDRFAKRGRFGDDAMAASQPRERDFSPSRASHRTLQSSVILPTIETKSRAAMINELKKHENKEEQVRTRRLFSNLLVGTLRQFQKEEKTVGNKGLAQIEKQREVERRLEETEKENRAKMLREKEMLLAKRREKESEIQALRRQKAIEQSAEEKTKHFRRLQCFIQTQTKPPMFFLPAKHTLRTLELLKESSRKIEALIELRREEMDRELRRLESFTSSGVATQANKNHESDHEEDENKGLKSAVMIKKEEVMDEDKDRMVDENGVNEERVTKEVLVSNDGDGGEEEQGKENNKDGDEKNDAEEARAGASDGEGYEV